MNRARPAATAATALATLAAATNLHTALAGWSWFWPVLAVIVVVAVISAFTRALRLPVFAQPVLVAAGLLLLVTRLYAHTHAVAGFIPTGKSWSQLRTLANNGVTDIRDLTAPAPATHDLVFLALLVVGAVALAVDLLAVGGDHPPLAGLPLVMLVAVPAGIRERGVGTVTLLLAFIGFLGLLALDSGSRARRWGRVLTAPSIADGPGDGTTGNGWRIGALALVAALVVPFAIPGGHSDPFGDAGGDGGFDGGSGGHSATVVDPFVQIAAELTTQSTTQLLTVQTSTPTYLRMTALDILTDSGFSLAKLTAFPRNQVSRGIPPATLSATGLSVPTQTVSVGVVATPNISEQFLPVPQNPTQVRVNGDWRLFAPTDTIFSTSSNLSSSSYSATSAEPDPTPELLESSGGIGGYPETIATDLSVPADISAVVAPTALAWTKGATTEYEDVLDIQDHFTDGTFKYNTAVAYHPGAIGFEQFLQQKQGFCEQYASTMVAMLRAMGIPARIGIGFTQGTQTENGSYVIDGADAHAWPEVYFPSAGWIRFEPTPLAAGHGLVPNYAKPDDLSGGLGPSSSTQPSTSPSAGSTSPSPSASSSSAAHHVRTAVSGTGGGNHGGGLALPVIVGVLVVLALLALMPALLTVLYRRRRVRAGPLALWEQLLSDCADRGLALPRSASPRTVARLVGARLALSGADTPDVLGGLAALVAAVEQVRFAPPRVTEVTGSADGAGSADTPGSADMAGAESGLGAAVTAVRHGMDAGLPWAARLRVALAPASTRSRLIAPLRSRGVAASAATDTVLSTALSTAVRLIGRLRPRRAGAAG